MKAFERTRSSAFKFGALAALAGIALITAWAYLTQRSLSDVRTSFLSIFPEHHDDNSPDPLKPPSKPTKKSHPIEHLMYKAYKEWNETLAKEATTLEEAARRYRERRGRHPPPRFDEWFRYAQERDAVIVEEFFDRIHDDLDPFWGVDPQTLKRQARSVEHRISIRNGKVSVATDVEREWMTIWPKLFRTLSKYIPDVDLAINVMDEPRLVVPWDDIEKLLGEAAKTKSVENMTDAKTEFSGLAKFDASDPEELPPTFSGQGPYWRYVEPACPPDSPGHGLKPMKDYSKPPSFEDAFPINSFKGYVSNFTFTKDPCLNPKLRQLHGSFIEPVSLSTSTKIFPMFGGSKLSMNNDILLPPAMYWTDDPRYSGGKSHGANWRGKRDQVMWRGAASGGRNRPGTWSRFQRHRFVFMMNGTNMRDYEAHSDRFPAHLTLPPYERYGLGARRKGHNLGSWLAGLTNVAFVNLLCLKPGEDSRRCSYTDAFYKVVGPKPMSEQYEFKYLPDVDGNSFSGRYRAFLLSTSLPIKATMYNEWGDSRIQPWLHFVPMDNTMVDLYGILDYYVSTNDRKGHDEEARWIAMQGKAWAEKVLRHEDMQIYVYRLLLEYARVVDDDRDRLAWVDDLMGTAGD